MEDGHPTPEMAILLPVEFHTPAYLSPRGRITAGRNAYLGKWNQTGEPTSVIHILLPCTFHTPVPQTVPQVDSGIGSAPLPAPEIGSRHRCTPFTARVRLPVSLCHIANSKNARKFNASHNQLRRLKLRTVNSHFATLPVRHRASGMYLRSHLRRFNRPLVHFCETYTGQNSQESAPTLGQGTPLPRATSSARTTGPLPSCWDATPSRISA